MTYNAPQLLILDEPTNHLDIDGREALINALNEYNGSVILITHDIHLIELIADNLWLVKDGCCRPYDGDLADYRNLLLAKTEPEKKVKPKPEVPKVNVREERKSVSARLRRVEREMEKLNADRAAIEAASSRWSSVQQLPSSSLPKQSPASICSVSRSNSLSTLTPIW